MSWDTIVADPEFQALEPDRKQKIASNYFAKNFESDKDFLSLPEEKRFKIKSNFESTLKLEPSLPRRSIAGDVLSAAARAPLRLGQRIGSSLKYFDQPGGLDIARNIGETLTELPEKAAERFDIFKPSQQETGEGIKGLARRAITGGIEELPSSIAPALAGGATGLAIGSMIPIPGAPVIGSYVGAAAGTFGQFYTSSYQEAYEDAIKQGVPEDKARSVARKIGLIQGGIEAVTTPITLGFAMGKNVLKNLFVAPVKEGGKAIISEAGKKIVAEGTEAVLNKSIRSILTPTIKEAAKTIGKVSAIEVPQEMVQDELDALVRRQAGMEAPAFGESAAEAAGPAAVMSILMGGGGHIYNKAYTGSVKRALQNPRGIDKEARLRAAQFTASTIAEESKNPFLGQLWLDNAEKDIEAGKPISLESKIDDLATMPLEKPQKPKATGLKLEQPTKAEIPKFESEPVIKVKGEGLKIEPIIEKTIEKKPIVSYEENIIVKGEKPVTLEKPITKPIIEELPKEKEIPVTLTPKEKPRGLIPTKEIWDKTPFDVQHEWDDVIDYLEEARKEYEANVKTLKTELASLRGRGNKERKDELKKQIDELTTDYKSVEGEYEERAYKSSEELRNQAIGKAKKLGLTDEDTLEQFADDFLLESSPERPYIEVNYDKTTQQVFDEVLDRYLTTQKPKEVIASEETKGQEAQESLPLVPEQGTSPETKGLPAGEVAPVVSKEPWQMSALEYAKSRVPESMREQITSRQKTFEPQHKKEIQAALDRGELVPPEVLKDYPDLQKQTHTMPSGEVMPGAEHKEALKKGGGEYAEILREREVQGSIAQGKEPEQVPIEEGGRREIKRGRGIQEYEEKEIKPEAPTIPVSPVEAKIKKGTKEGESLTTITDLKTRIDKAIATKAYEIIADKYKNDKSLTKHGRFVIPTGEEGTKINAEILRTENELRNNKELIDKVKRKYDEEIEMVEFEKKENERFRRGESLTSRQVLAKQMKQAGMSDAEIEANIQLLIEAPAKALGIPEDEFITQVKRSTLAELEGQKVQYQSQEQAKEFYSHLEDVIEKSSQARYVPQQLLNYLKAQGVKEAEIEATGLKDYLKEKGNVSKDELLEYLKGNQVEVKIKILGESISQKIGKQYYEELEEIDELFGRGGQISSHERNRRIEELNNKYGIKNISREMAINEKGIMHDAEGNIVYKYEGSLSPTKFSQWVEPGGNNYKEILLTLPVKEKYDIKKTFNDYAVQEYGKKWDELDKEQQFKIQTELGKQQLNKYKSPHYEEPNIIAHIRIDDRTDANDKKVLFVEEIQSDWATEGKKKGYQLSPERAAELEKRRLELETIGRDATPEQKQEWVAVINELQPNKPDRVPRFPFSKTWHELALKHILRYASENGYDSIAWTTGEMQQNRYDLSKQVDSIHYFKFKNKDLYNIAIIKNGSEIKNFEISTKDLSDFVGKDIAKKITDNEGDDSGEGSKILSGLDLKIGGKWAKRLYDEMIPQYLNKYVKKWGGKVNESFINKWKDTNLIVKPYNSDYGDWAVFDAQGFIIRGTEASKEGAEDYIKKIAGTGKAKVQSLDITPAIKKAVLSEGQPLFQDKRGAIQFGKDGKAIIHLLENADKSTFAHEMFHKYIEMMQRLPQLKPQLKILETWIGKPVGKWSTADHEKAAKGGEKYLYEGNAPTSTLKVVFEKFKNWLHEIYKTAKSLDIKLSADVRKMWDEWFGGKEIKGEMLSIPGEELTKQGLIRPSTSTFGMKAGRWQYKAKDGIYTTASSKEEAIKARQKIEEEIKQTIKNVPLHKEILQEAKTENIFKQIKAITTNVKIDQSFFDHFDRSELIPIQRQSPGLFSNQKGMPLDEIADGLGISTDELADKIRNAISQKQDVELLTKQFKEYIPLVEMITVGDLGLKVGDKFKIHGEQYAVKEKDAEGNFLIEDGDKFIVDELDKIPIPDEGSLKKGKYIQPKLLEGEKTDIKPKMETEVRGQKKMLFQSEIEKENFIKNVVDKFSNWNEEKRAYKEAIANGIIKEDISEDFRSKVKQWMSFPKTVAKKFPAFKKFYDRAEKYFEDYDSYATTMGNVVKPYMDLENQEAINKLLIDARLNKQYAYSKEELQKAGHSDAVIQEYLSVVNTMNQALHNLTNMLNRTGNDIEKIYTSISKIKGMRNLLKPYKALEDKKKIDNALRNTIWGIKGSQALVKVFKKQELIDMGLSIEERQSYDSITKLMYKNSNYVPFKRYGNWFVAVNDPEGNLVEYTFHESQKEMARDAMEMIEKYPGHEIVTGNVKKLATEAYQNMPINILTMLKEFDEQLDTEFSKVYANIIGKGFPVHLIESKKIAGFEKDLSKSIADYILGISRWMAAKEARNDFSKMLTEIDPRKQAQLYGYASRYAEYVIGNSKEGSQVRQFMFRYYLGAVVKSAMLNFTQSLTTTLPTSAKYIEGSIIRRSRLMAEAIKTAATSIDKLKVSNPKLAEGLQKAIKDGKISEAMVKELRGEVYGKKLNKLDKILSFMFEFAEQSNRKIAFIMAYNEAITNGVKTEGKKGRYKVLEHEEAIKFAEDFIDETQFIYSRQNKPEMARGWKAPIFTFRVFSGSYLSLLKSMILEKEFKAITEALGIMLLLGGLAAFPGLKEIGKALELMGYDPKKAIKKRFGQWGDLSLHGILYPLGIDLSGALGTIEVVPGDIQQGIVPAIGGLILGVPMDIPKRIGRAWTLLTKNKDPYRAVEAIMPEAIRNPMVAVRWLREGEAKSPTYEPITKVGGMDIALKFFGIQPATLSKAYEREHSESILRNLNYSEGYNWRIAKALYKKDSDEFKDILEEIKEHNVKVGKAIAGGDKEAVKKYILPTRQGIQRNLLKMVSPQASELKSMPKVLRPAYREIQEVMK